MPLYAASRIDTHYSSSSFLYETLQVGFLGERSVSNYSWTIIIDYVIVFRSVRLVRPTLFTKVAPMGFTPIPREHCSQVPRNQAPRSLYQQRRRTLLVMIALAEEALPVVKAHTAHAPKRNLQHPGGTEFHHRRHSRRSHEKHLWGAGENLWRAALRVLRRSALGRGQLRR